MTTVQYGKRQSGETWDSVPTIGGSHWGFIGAMAAVLVIILVMIAICVCVFRKRKTKKKMRHAAMGSDLSALHPQPTFGRGSRPARQSRTLDDEEADAFVASSPRQSLSYAGPIAGERYQYDDMHMKDMNGRYYRGSEGFEQGYHSYSQDNTFAEPQWQQQPSEGYAGRHKHQISSGDGYSGHGYQESIGSYEHPGHGAPDASQYPSAGHHPVVPRSRAPPSAAPPPHAAFQAQNATPAYPQRGYSQTGYPQEAYQTESYPQEGSYPQEYSSYPSEHPPSYPETSHIHTHDLSKARMGPAAV